MIISRQITVPTIAALPPPTLRSPSLQQQHHHHHHHRIILSVLFSSCSSSARCSNNNTGRKTRLKPCAAVLRPDTVFTQQKQQQSTDDVLNSLNEGTDSGNNGDNNNNNNNNGDDNNGGDGNSGGGSGNGGSSGAPFSRDNATNIFLLLVNGVKDRITADPDFTYKLLVECGLDAAIILGVNYNLRGEDFLAEIDFTLCQLAISLLSDFALVYLLAPTTASTALAKIGAVASTNSTNSRSTRIRRLKAWVEALPAHVFQRSSISTSTPPFTIGHRAGTFLLKAVQYGSVGSTMGFLGTSAVHALIRTRELLDPAFSPPATVQSPQGVAAAWGTFMASSSNVRYNLVNASEDFLYSKGGVIGKLGSVVLRLANNWAGAAQWIVLCNRTTLFNVETPWEPLKEDERGLKRKK